MNSQNETESTMWHSIVTDKQETLQHHLVVPQTTMSATNKRQNTTLTPSMSAKTTIKATGNSTMKEDSNETKQKELRLKKKEEQLRIKEELLNEDVKEKSKLFERLFKAENRN